MNKPIPRSRLIAAWIIAVAADALQVVLFPFFIGGGLEGPDAIVDVVTGGLLTWLCGWHWVFLPTFALEFMPIIDEAPSWTIAMGWVTGKRWLFGKQDAGGPPVAAPPAEPPRKVTDIETK